MAGSTPEQHIMISYCWQAPAKEIMSEVKKQLERKGYKVWMDVEEMRGNMYDAMAQAIQHSFVVLACVTQGYQDSANCKRELSMANDGKKPIIPIKLGSFKEEDWLKASIAGLLYYTIHSVVEVEQMLPKIIGEIERIRGNAAGKNAGRKVDVQQTGANVNVNINSSVLGNINVQGQVVTSSPSGAANPAGRGESSQRVETDSKPAAAANRVKVTEKQLCELADNFPADDKSYKIFCDLLGIKANKADNMYAKHLNNRGDAVRACLQQYKNRTGAYRDELLRVLDEAEIGDLKEFIE